MNRLQRIAFRVAGMNPHGSVQFERAKGPGRWVAIAKFDGPPTSEDISSAQEALVYDADDMSITWRDRPEPYTSSTSGMGDPSLADEGGWWILGDAVDNG
jgi:hypothetical protein